MTMVSSNLLQQLERTPNILHDHERFTRPTEQNLILNENTASTSGSQIARTPPLGKSSTRENESTLDFCQAEQTLSDLKLQESKGNLQDTLQEQTLDHSECINSINPTRTFLSTSSTASTGACSTNMSTPSMGYSDHSLSMKTPPNTDMHSENARTSVPYEYPKLQTPPKYSTFFPKHHVSSATINTISPNECYGSAASSVSGSFQKPGISPCRPMLYSAIASFENMSNSSSYLKDMTAKVISMKETSQYTRILIPPVRPHRRSHSPTNNQLENSNSEEKHLTPERSLKTNVEEELFHEEPLHDSEKTDVSKAKKHISTLTEQLSYTSLNKLDDHEQNFPKSSSLGANLNNLDPSPEMIKSKSLTTNEEKQAQRKRIRKSRKSKNRKPEVIFCPSSDAYTPLISSSSKPLSYVPAADRASSAIPTTMGTISRPNFRDALRRVAMILHQHIVKIERRFESDKDPSGLFSPKMRKEFKEDNYAKPRYKCTMVRVPMARAGAIYSLKKLKADYETPDALSPSSVRIPTEVEIYEFAHKLFKKVQLSSECSIVCLIYIERLMEVARVPLMACTWRPIFMAGLLLASKVWQDLSSWNIEFAIVYPQFSLESINRLELQFLRMVKWDLYISSSLYAKYYFALRSLLEKKTFRQRYNRMVGGVGSVDASDALKIQQRTEKMKEQALIQLSRSM